MARTKIIITGTPEKEPKINKDKTVELLFRSSMSEGVPKGLKNLGESIYLVRISRKAWKKVAENVTNDSIYLIQGEPKASVNKNNIPFIIITCFDISLKESPISALQKTAAPSNEADNKPIITTLPETAVNDPENPKSPINSMEQDQHHQKKVTYTWYNSLKDKLVVINLDDVSIIEENHLMAYSVNIKGLNFAKSNGYINAPIAVRPVADGKYVLVVGYKPYIQGKLLNFKTIRAYITDLSHDDFVVKFSIDESK